MDTLDIMNSPAQDLSTERPTENTNIPAPFKPKKHRRSRHDPEPDWSAQMREKISKSHRRMGHACDRCKLKKMKCTPEIEGCACCRALNLPCKVTDRVTGETFVRGAAGNMRRMIEDLNKENYDLKRENGLLKQEIAQKDLRYEQLELSCEDLKVRYFQLRDERERKLYKTDPFSDNFAYEDDSDTEVPQQDGVL